VADIELTDGQIDWFGIPLGPGTSINIIDISGLGRPSTRDNDTDQPSADGAWPGPDYYAPRQVQIDAAIKTPGNRDACETLLAQIQEAADDPTVRLVGGATQALRYKRPGRTVKRLYGRVRRIDPEIGQAKHGYIPLDLEFLGTDPTWYADEEQVTEIPLGWLTGGGFAAPVTAPIHVQDGTTAADRPGWVTNNGTTDTWPIIRITGPVATVTVTHVPTGRQLVMPTLNLDAGQWIEIDTRPGRCTVLRENGGTADVLSPSSRIDEFALPPGQSEMRWTGFDSTITARLRLTWRDAYKAL
jgi:hypothetical protein